MHYNTIIEEARRRVQPDAEGRWGLDIDGKQFFFSKKDWMMGGLKLLLTTPAASVWCGRPIHYNNIHVTCGAGWLAVTDDIGNILE